MQRLSSSCLSLGCLLLLCATGACDEASEASKDEITVANGDGGPVQEPKDAAVADTEVPRDAQLGSNDAQSGARDAQTGASRDAQTGGGKDGATSSVPDASTPSADGGITQGASGCKPVTLAQVTVESTASDSFSWSDGDCQPRTAVLFRNDKADGFGHRGGYMHSYSYVQNGKTLNIKGASGYHGIGYVVAHPDFVNTRTAGTFQTLLAGKHHAIHQFKLSANFGGPVDITVHWFFATGRSHPLYAITYDASRAPANSINYDSRSPYGEMMFDDNQGGPVDGVGWGDKYKLVTTTTLGADADWDYTKPNKVPYAFEWSSATDREMGLVATQLFATKPQGGDYGGGILAQRWGKTGTNLMAQDQLPDWLWPFQLNQYEIPFTNISHRLAWGMSYGAVGKTSYTAFDRTLVGHPYQSYTVAIVLGTHAKSAVAEAVSETEAMLSAKLSASRGTVAKEGPGGVGRADRVTFSPAGWDDTYAVWTLDAASDAATFTLDAGAGTLRNPVFVLRDYSAAGVNSVTLNGKTLTADVDYFASVDGAGKRLWITLSGDLTGAATITVD